MVELNGYVLLFRSQYRCLGQNDTMASWADNGTNGSYRNKEGGRKKGKQYRRGNERIDANQSYAKQRVDKSYRANKIVSISQK